ncbi:MAG: MFS transporter [Actinomycetota bacterium]
MRTPPEQGVLRSLLLSIYLPILTTQTGLGMLVPTLPLYLRELGFGFTLVTVVLAGTGIGGLLANAPAGRLLERDDTDLAVVIGVGTMAGSMATLALVESAALLTLSQAVTGAGAVVLILSRQTVVLRRTPADMRGRAMSFVGGTQRVSFLAGPAVGGFLADAVGFRSTFLVAATLAAIGLLPGALGRGASGAGSSRHRRPVAPFRHVVRQHARSLAAAGSGQLGSMAIRFGRQALFPLYGAAIGLEAGQIGLIVSLSALADLAVFPISGVLMDGRGRLWAVVPAFTIMSLGMFVLAATDGTAGLVLSGLLVGVGNGIGSGTMLTVSTDLAPAESPGQFLAALGLVRDVGRMGGPLVVGIAADRLGIDWSAIALGLIGLATVAVFVLVVGETKPMPADEDAQRGA